MCKSCDPFFYTGVIRDARCARYYEVVKWTKYILKLHLLRYPYKGCKLCTHQCECVGTNTSSLTEEQVFVFIDVIENDMDIQVPTEAFIM